MSYNNRNNNHNRTNNSSHLITKNIDFKQTKVGDIKMEGKIGIAREGNYLREYHEKLQYTYK